MLIFFFIKKKEKVKKEFQYEDDVPKKKYEGYGGSSSGAGGGWDEVKQKRNESFNSKPSNQSKWEQPKQESFGGFSNAFDKFDYNKKESSGEKKFSDFSEFGKASFENKTKSNTTGFSNPNFDFNNFGGFGNSNDFGNFQKPQQSQPKSNNIDYDSQPFGNNTQPTKNEPPPVVVQKKGIDKIYIL